MAAPPGRSRGYDGLRTQLGAAAACGLERRRRDYASIVPCDRQGRVDPGDVAAPARPDAVGRRESRLERHRAVPSRVGVGRAAHRHGALFLLDAAQSLGHVPIDLRTRVSICWPRPGHKGLLGPLGTGLLYVAPGVERQLTPPRQGGTGTASDRRSSPTELPDKYEAGQSQRPGPAALAAGVEFLRAARQWLPSRPHTRPSPRGCWPSCPRLRGFAIHGPRRTCRADGALSASPSRVMSRRSLRRCSIRVPHSSSGRTALRCAGACRRLVRYANGGTVRFSAGLCNNASRKSIAVSRH